MGQHTIELYYKLSKQGASKAVSLLMLERGTMEELANNYDSSIPRFLFRGGCDFESMSLFRQSAYPKRFFCHKRPFTQHFIGPLRDSLYLFLTQNLTYP